MQNITIIGGGLAGCEAAWQAAEHGAHVLLYEMRPTTSTGAHQTAELAELVCSNSLGSNLFNRASGLLKEELRQLGSLLMRCADSCALPSGTALAVDRNSFSREVARQINSHANITLVLDEVKHIPDGIVIIATGPLTSPPLASAIQRLTGEDNLFFFDALAPILLHESINMEIAYRASRSENSDTEGDYINCPIETEEQYQRFVDALINAERVDLKEFEKNNLSNMPGENQKYFEGCLPIEVIAQRSSKALAFGPLRPIGLWNPHTRHRPYAVIQLRQDNLANTLYNMVGFQTNLTYPAQKRVFRMIPGLENAEFVRFGQMHRNTFIASPKILQPTLQTKSRPSAFFAGQITGVEGYVGNIATGLLAGINAARYQQGKRTIYPPLETMLGSLCYYITHADVNCFQPMKANFGLLPPLEYAEQSKMARYTGYSTRAINALLAWKEDI